ncbi:MAG: hypothetical protein AAF747_01405 [Planctomycetota bacterium]
MTEATTMESLEQQLVALYSEREQLSNRFGASSADDIIAMVENLEAQLTDFYDRFGSHAGFDDAESIIMLSRIRELGETLDPMYSKKSVHFFIENDKPVLRAEWSESISNGDEQ